MLRVPATSGRRLHQTIRLAEIADTGQTSRAMEGGNEIQPGGQCDE
jgi:hypothetical protein